MPLFAPASIVADARLQPRRPIQHLLLENPEGQSFAHRARPDYTPPDGSNRTLTVAKRAMLLIDDPAARIVRRQRGSFQPWIAAARQVGADRRALREPGRVGFERHQHLVAKWRCLAVHAEAEAA